ncbi:MAG: stage 0 sporulation protein [Verrucomicrobia bacterium]|nr:stage 0 sporulation protein [Verrucomicrobiota bacterium]
MHRKVRLEIEPGLQVACVSAQELAIHVGDQCIAEVNRVLEYGRVARLEDADGPMPADHGASRVMRRATLQDQAKANENALMGRIALNTCKKKMEKFKLAMRLVRLRYSFDRSILIITFTSEDRVDFRELVQELGSELGARIEMRQIGVRDEAGMIGGLGPCGRRMCCSSWLKHFDSVNVKMAKIQGVSLNPSAITGMCGRLKCCMKYEYDMYREYSRGVPRPGAFIRCPDGKGYVIDRDVLGGKVKVKLEDERVFEYSVEDISRAGGEHDDVEEAGDEDPRGEWAKLESPG